MKNSTFSELLWLFWFGVRGCVKHEKTRFVCDIRYFLAHMCVSEQIRWEKMGKLLDAKARKADICSQFVRVLRTCAWFCRM